MTKKISPVLKTFSGWLAIVSLILTQATPGYALRTVSAGQEEGTKALLTRALSNSAPAVAAGAEEAEELVEGEDYEINESGNTLFLKYVNTGRAVTFRNGVNLNPKGNAIRVGEGTVLFRGATVEGSVLIGRKVEAGGILVGTVERPLIIGDGAHLHRPNSNVKTSVIGPGAVLDSAVVKNAIVGPGAKINNANVFDSTVVSFSRDGKLTPASVGSGSNLFEGSVVFGGEVETNVKVYDHGVVGYAVKFANGSEHAAPFFWATAPGTPIFFPHVGFTETLLAISANIEGVEVGTPAYYERLRLIMRATTFGTLREMILDEQAPISSSGARYIAVFDLDGEEVRFPAQRVNFGGGTIDSDYDPLTGARWSGVVEGGFASGVHANLKFPMVAGGRVLVGSTAHGTGHLAANSVTIGAYRGDPATLADIRDPKRGFSLPSGISNDLAVQIDYFQRLAIVAEVFVEAARRASDPFQLAGYAASVRAIQGAWDGIGPRTKKILTKALDISLESLRRQAASEQDRARKSRLETRVREQEELKGNRDRLVAQIDGVGQIIDSSAQAVAAASRDAIDQAVRDQILNPGTPWSNPLAEQALQRPVGYVEEEALLAQLNQFEIPDGISFTGRNTQIELIASGRVNRTYRVTHAASGRQFVLQRLATIFRVPAMNANLRYWADAQQKAKEQGVLTESWQVVQFHPAKGGQDPIVVDAAGLAWRVADFVEGQIFQSVDEAPAADQAAVSRGAVESMVLFRRVAELQTGVTWQEPLPHFHDTAYHWSYFNDIVAGRDRGVALREETGNRVLIVPGILDAADNNRGARAKAFIDQARQRQHLVSALKDVARGVAHGDPKLNNLVFARNADTNQLEVVSILDLDTIGPDHVLLDFADAMRLVVNPAGEEPVSLDDVRVNADGVRAAVATYLQAVRQYYGQDEVERIRPYLLASMENILFELSIRFFYSYLTGDSYFQRAPGKQKDLYLYAAEVQMRTLEELEKTFGVVGADGRSDAFAAAGAEETLAQAVPLNQVPVTYPRQAVPDFTKASFALVVLAAGNSKRWEESIVEARRQDEFTVFDPDTSQPVVRSKVLTLVPNVPGFPADQRVPVGFLPVSAAIAMGGQVIVVVGNQAGFVQQEFGALDTQGRVSFVEQRERNGTGAAIYLAQAVGNLSKATNLPVIVTAGDQPLFDTTFFGGILELLTPGTDLVVGTARVSNPTGKGRIVRNKNGEAIVGILEQRDIDAIQQGAEVPAIYRDAGWTNGDELHAIDEVNTGVYAMRAGTMETALGQITANNAQKQFYAPDMISQLLAQGRVVASFDVPAWRMPDLTEIGDLQPVLAAIQQHSELRYTAAGAEEGTVMSRQDAVTTIYAFVAEKLGADETGVEVWAYNPKKAPNSSNGTGRNLTSLRVQKLVDFAATGANVSVSFGGDRGNRIDIRAAAGTEERVSLPSASQTVFNGLGVVAGPYTTGLQWGLAIARNGRQQNGGRVPVAFLISNDEQRAQLTEAGIHPELIFTDQTEALNAISGYGVNPVLVGVNGPVTESVRVLFETLFGIELSEAQADFWQGVYADAAVVVNA